MIVNGYSIEYSTIYEKFQVWDCGTCLEEFRDINDAIKWAEQN